MTFEKAAATRPVLLTLDDLQWADEGSVALLGFLGRRLVTAEIVIIAAYREAEANMKAAEATLQTAQLNLGYTEVRAPVAGRVGKIEITVGNLIAAGPGTPVLTTLVSINPIYASFNADEQVVTRALK